MLPLLPFHPALVGESLGSHLQNDPINFFEFGAFLIGESRPPGFFARVRLEACASADICVDASQKWFECTGAHARTSWATARLARPRASAWRAISIWAIKQSIEG